MSGRALVLGGGGSAGNAWLIGVAAGLFDGGTDVRAADLVVGTSAGATAAAQILGAPPGRLLADIRSAGPAPDGPAGAPIGPAADHMARTQDIIESAADAADMRRKLGAAALAMAGAADPGRWRATVAARLPGLDWPRTPLLIAAVDAVSGEPVVFDRHGGVDLADAVAASTSNGFGVPPYPIGDRRYIDGGYRADVNADLAAGCDRVLILAPFGARTRKPPAWGLHLTAQAEALRAAGSRVETIFPDGRALAAFGDNMMDLSRRAPSAGAGYDQGRSLAEALGAFWD